MTWSLASYTANGAAGFGVLREDGTLVAPTDLKRWSSALELLEDWPAGKGLGLGIVDARNVRLEEIGVLLEQVGRGVAAAGEANVHVSPSCGLEFLPRETARRKLELVARATHAQGVTV